MTRKEKTRLNQLRWARHLLATATPEMLRLLAETPPPPPKLPPFDLPSLGTLEMPAHWQVTDAMLKRVGIPVPRKKAARSKG